MTKAADFEKAHRLATKGVFNFLMVSITMIFEWRVLKSQ